MNDLRRAISIAVFALLLPAAVAFADSLPDRIELSIDARENGERFVSVGGRTNLPAGWRVLVRVAGAPARGVELAENALAVVDGAGAFVVDTLLSYPLSYTVTAELSAAANPERAGQFGPDLRDRATEGLDIQPAADGTLRLIAHATVRLGTPEQEDALIAERLTRLTERADRMARDREQIERIGTAADAAAASSFYIAWTRIRADKAHEFGLDAPAIDPLFGSLDLAIRDAWRDLDGVGLAGLAERIGDTDEERRLEPRVRKFDRAIAKIRTRLAALRGDEQ